MTLVADHYILGNAVTHKVTLPSFLLPEVNGYCEKRKGPMATLLDT